MKHARSSQSFRRTTNRPQRHERKEPRRGRGFIAAILFFGLLLGFGLIYVSQVNAVATSGLVTKDLEQKIRTLERVNQDLELRAASLRSLATVEQTSKELDLFVRANIEYLPPLSETVARGD